jgi:hypothetical protein
MLSTRAVVIGSLLFSAVAYAQEGVVEAVGEANIKNGDTVAAKKAATADALKKCIEKVVGISMQSEFTSEQSETLKNNQSEFNQKVKDSLIQKAEGFIQRYEVIDEKADGTVMKVKVQAHVFESKVKAEVKKLGDLIAAAGNPKLMLVIQEVLLGADGTKKVQKESVLAASLEEELIARGFELRGKGTAKDLGDNSLKEFEGWMGDSEAAAKVARDQGADILIFGRVEINDKGEITDTGGLDALKGQRRIEIQSVIRGLNAATKETFSAKPVQMSSVGINVEKALFRAFKGRGDNLVKQTFTALLEDLKGSFKKTAEQGQQYVIVLKGVKSFRKQGQKFLDVLGAIDGVSNVKQKSFAGDSLLVDLNCKCSSKELQDRIFGASGGQTDLDSLDVESASGKELSFKL